MDKKEVQRLSKGFFDVQGLRSVAYLDNLSRCDQIRTLTHPLISGPSIEDLDDS